MGKKTKVKDGKFYIVEDKETELTLEQINGMLDSAENQFQHAKDVLKEVQKLKEDYMKNMSPDPNPEP